MDFQVYITKEILERIEKLPAKLQAEFLLRLKWIVKDGLTTIGPNDLKLSGRWFAVRFCQAHDSLELKNGFVLKGYLAESKKDRVDIFCTGYYEVKNAKPKNAIGSNKKFEIEKVKRAKKKDCANAGKSWFNKKFSDPKIEKAFEAGLMMQDEFVPCTSNTEIKALFYPDLVQILAYAEHISKYESKPPFASLCPNNCEHHILGGSVDLVAGKKKTVLGFLEEFKEDAVFVVNFVDEQDIFNYAQRDFSSLLANHINHILPYSKVAIVDIVIRKKNGEKPFWAEFLKYYEDNKLIKGQHEGTCEPHPFSMIMARTRGRPAITRLLDFDLFAGCRNKINAVTDHFTYRQNLDRIIHQALGVVGYTTETFAVQVKDFTKYSRYEAAGRIQELSKGALTVTFNKKNKRAHKKALQTCLNLIGKGYPFVAMAKTHIEEDKVGLIYNGIEESVDLNNLEKEMIDRYERHVLLFAPSEARIKLDVKNTYSVH